VFKIEKGVELPPERQSASTYPWRQMEIGDSFVIEKSLVGRASVAAAYFSRRNPGFKFTMRKQADGTRRIWRVKGAA
jgi:hypothetical protein